MYFSGEENAKAKRIEFRAPDPTANPYLAFPAILMAGLDGVKRKIDPVKAGFGPLDKNIWELSGAEKDKIRSVPGSLKGSVAALEKDHDYLLAGGVFTEDVLDMWKGLKEPEILEVSLRPTPYEFHLYSTI
jgi:glutamine synthetase